MATIMAPRVQHIGALANVTANNCIPKAKPTGKDRKVHFVPITRITSPSVVKAKPKLKYTHTMEEENYHKLLKTPDSVTLLNVDNGTVALDAPSAPPSPNMSKRRVNAASSPRAPTPTTPPVASK